ncbi:DUF1206 domain-containing protein [Aeromicrobium sp.]|uniref:DUF1206 domain-containing protein n=1 Tax=Aeromicrobium sp. TaxID=1871063 RepID=UPI003511B0C4
MPLDADDVVAHADDAWVDHLVRFGFVAYGLVHLVLAFLALQLAFGHRSGSADTRGALAELAQQPFGRTVLWLVVTGMAVLVLWRVLEAAVGHRDDDGARLWAARGADLVKAVVYGVVGWSGVQVVTRSSDAGGSGSETWTARALALPAGAVLVGVAGLAVVGYGAWTAWRGLSDRHREHLAPEGLSGASGDWLLRLGAVGHVAKGVAIGLVGILFCFAALTRDADRSGGLDEALRTVLQQPFGPWLLALIAVGIGLYGVWCLVRARYLDR